ncbi:MAG: hypothetical protein QGD94_05945, partial [Planctomycetia bacterium]|nr:hypothetical protein [Planctomycetia bacterium]
MGCLDMTEEEFEEIVDEALSDLPAEIAEKLENVGVVIEDSPSEEQHSRVGIGGGGTLLALYQ